MASSGGMVTHICTHPLKKLPPPVHGMMVPEPTVMRNVDFLYLENVKNLVQWCADIHTKAELPSLIVVEDILTYACQIDEMNIERSLARLCATISDSVSWVAQNNKLRSCLVILTAPARLTSLEHVLTQLDFRVATYQGPQKEETNSCLSVSGSGATLKVLFCREKECILMKDVSGTVHNI
ncbi:uncharacterized protein LOC101851897 isoform X2 [Aplysia californica]|nr:uncharacterized protein LOC101851897 isoform X2 [Aplysia californica]